MVIVLFFTLSGALFSQAPVDRLNVRGISVRMGRQQVLAAAKAAGMVVREDRPQQLKITDATAAGTPTGTGMGYGGKGLVLVIDFKDDKSVKVNISEQGELTNQMFDDLSKKWGKPSSLPYGWEDERGAPGDKATWGDKKNIYADYNPSLYSYFPKSVTIYDAVALAPHTQPRQRIPM
jgi:hypothetical protein